MKKMVWPVYGFSAERWFGKEPVATFLEWGAAASFCGDPLANGGWEKRNLHMAAPKRIGGSCHADL
jgi:hypothetical protein